MVGALALQHETTVDRYDPLSFSIKHVLHRPDSD